MTARPYCELVGERGFEPPTSSSRTKRATELRYSPKVCKSITHVEIKGQIGLSAVGRRGIHCRPPATHHPNQIKFSGHSFRWCLLAPISIQATDRPMASPKASRYPSLSSQPPDNSAILRWISSRASSRIPVDSRVGNLGGRLSLFPVAPWPYASAGSCSAASNTSASRRLSGSSLRAMIRWSVEMARASPSLAIFIAISSRLSW